LLLRTLIERKEGNQKKAGKTYGKADEKRNFRKKSHAKTKKKQGRKKLEAHRGQVF